MPSRSAASHPVRITLLSLLLFGGVLTSPARAQNPDLMLSQAERDSILKTYHNVFPFLGRKAIERGFDLPKPAGINLIGMWIDQKIDISNLGLSTGSNPVAPMEAIGFGTNTSTIYSGNVRAELWVLPFLNVYVLGGAAQSNTTVEVLAGPASFTSSVDQTGNYFGTGLTGAFGIKRNFASVDVNWAWTSLEKLDEPVRSRVLGLRFGRAFKLGPQRRLAIWVGAMNVKFKTETNGSLPLSEAIPPETVAAIRDKLENIDDSEWYQGLNPIQQALVDQLVDRLLSSNAGDTTINYSLDKAPADPWNMLIGSNLDLNKRWSARVEVGMIGRKSVLAGLVYRLDL